MRNCEIANSHILSEAGNELSEAGNELSEAGNELSEAGNELSEAGNQLSEAGRELSDNVRDLVETSEDPDYDLAISQLAVFVSSCDSAVSQRLKKGSINLNIILHPGIRSEPK